jgi:hypothetical protein
MSGDDAEKRVGASPGANVRIRSADDVRGLSRERFGEKRHSSQTDVR